MKYAVSVVSGSYDQGKADDAGGYARIPMSSRNPDIDELGKNKARLILMNKADLADDKKTEQWMDYFKGRGFYAVKLDSRKKNGMKSVQNVIAEACKEKT